MKRKGMFLGVCIAGLLMSCAGAPTGTSADAFSFSGTYDNAARYLKHIKKNLEQIAGGREHLYTFINENVTGGNAGTDISMNLSRSIGADVLKIIDNHQGPVVYLVFSDKNLAKEPFSGDSEAKLLYENFSTRLNDYGLSGDAFKTLQRAFPRVAWKSK
jgi:hypothetical protein